VKIVVHANIFASGIIKPNSIPGKILFLIQKNEVELVISPSIITEIKRILLYPKLRKYHRRSPQELDSYFEDLLMFAWVTEGERAVNVVQDDPTDNKYLSCAVEGGADYIISGDHHLLDLEAYQGITITTARGFLQNSCFTASD